MSKPSEVLILPVVADESPIVLQPEVTAQQKTRNVKDEHEDNGVNVIDNDNDDDDRGAIASWFCYRLILASLLAMVVCFATLVFSCRSFRDGYGYYGFRGETTTNGRCEDWEIQNGMQWTVRQYERMSKLYTRGIFGVVLIVAITLFWMAYGLVLKSSRERRRRGDQPPPGDASCTTIVPVVVGSVALVVIGCLIFSTIMENCNNIPPLSSGNLGCDLWMWSSLAIFASVASCVIGCTLFSGLMCCCRGCCCNERLRGQLM